MYLLCKAVKDELTFQQNFSQRTARPVSLSSYLLKLSRACVFCSSSDGAPSPSTNSASSGLSRLAAVSMPSTSCVPWARRQAEQRTSVQSWQNSSSICLGWLGQKAFSVIGPAPWVENRGTLLWAIPHSSQSANLQTSQ